jgi:hypothetical protein
LAGPKWFHLTGDWRLLELLLVLLRLFSSLVSTKTDISFEQNW